jgi:uncharacterized protein (DUF924 family)
VPRRGLSVSGMAQILAAQAVLDFWFDELGPKVWFAKSDETDELIKNRFELTHKAAVACELVGWRVDVGGRLAEIIVLDQFSRNLFRDDARAFAADPMALALAQEAIRLGLDVDLAIQQRAFLYMPFMHSESALIHGQAVELFSTPGLEFNLEFELKHKLIIDRFGRYPHRNTVLGRMSSEAEIAFLNEPGSSF